MILPREYQVNEDIVRAICGLNHKWRLWTPMLKWYISYKSLEGYNYLVNGWINNITVLRSDGQFMFPASVKYSQFVSYATEGMDSYQIWWNYAPICNIDFTTLKQKRKLSLKDDEECGSSKPTYKIPKLTNEDIDAHYLSRLQVNPVLLSFVDEFSYSYACPYMKEESSWNHCHLCVKTRSLCLLQICWMSVNRYTRIQQ